MKIVAAPEIARIATDVLGRLDSIYEAHGSAVFNFGFFLTGSAQEAEQLTRKVFSRTFAILVFDEWAEITETKLIADLIKLLREKELSLTAEVCTTTRTRFDKEVDFVINFLDGFSFEDRLYFVMRDVCGYSLHSIAQLSELSLLAVRKNVALARRSARRAARAAFRQAPLGSAKERFANQEDQLKNQATLVF